MSIEKIKGIEVKPGVIEMTSVEAKINEIIDWANKMEKRKFLTLGKSDGKNSAGFDPNWKPTTQILN